MAEGAITDIARERDQALGRLQALAAEIRAHEQDIRDDVAWLRRINGGSDGGGEQDVGEERQGLQPIGREDARSDEKGREQWA
jgi:hypothetical protein